FTGFDAYTSVAAVYVCHRSRATLGRLESVAERTCESPGRHIAHERFRWNPRCRFRPGRVRGRCVTSRDERALFSSRTTDRKVRMSRELVYTGFMSLDGV